MKLLPKQTFAFAATNGSTYGVAWSDTAGVQAAFGASLPVDPGSAVGGGRFQPSRGVSGAEATDAVVKVLALSGAR